MMAKELKYPVALEMSGKDDVYVGRIRRDFSVDNGLNLWVVANNIRKGAAIKFEESKCQYFKAQL